MEHKVIKNYIVITSIFNPTESVYAFSRMEHFQLIVVGDAKTPEDWSCQNVDFLSLKKQEALDFKIAKMLPFNHYGRKMLGYLRAIEKGAETIIDTDDDNNPTEKWCFPKFDQLYDCISEDKGFVNIYQLYTKQKIWTRGLPLNQINKNFELEKQLLKKECKVGIWQGLANEDPDVDAIYRLTNDTPCIFEERDPVVLSRGTISPFNSQNTMIRKELFPLLYLPTFVTFRFTDILRGLVAQPIMWLYGYQLGFINATVTQKRNPHDYMHDFISEIPMHQHGDKIVEIVSKVVSKSLSIEANLYNAYLALYNEKIVCEQEITTLRAWLDDLAALKIDNN